MQLLQLQLVQSRGGTSCFFHAEKESPISSDGRLSDTRLLDSSYIAGWTQLLIKVGGLAFPGNFLLSFTRELRELRLQKVSRCVTPDLPGPVMA